MKQKIGFIGLGLMGMPMAKNILKKAFPLTVYNRTKEKTKELQEWGANAVDTPELLVAASDIIITMVTAARDVEEVLFGGNGVTKNPKKRLLVIDMSTIGPTAAKSISAKLEKLDIDFLDAPVTGSTPKAISGELTIFIGGKEENFEKAKSVLSAMGTNLQYMGPSGSGQVIKLINNFFLAASTIAMAEGMLFADMLQVPRQKIADALASTPNLSPSMKLKLPGLVSGEIPLMFSMANMRKDVGLAEAEMEKAQKQLPELSLVEKLYGEANETELSKEDFSAIISFLQRK